VAESSELCERDNTQDSLSISLVGWGSYINVLQVAITGLLQVLQPFHADLPTDARSLMRTPRSLCIKQMTGGGEYVHFGVNRGLEQLYNGGHLAMHSTLQLQFALYKSSNTSLWPILCSLKNISNAELFVVGVFCGRPMLMNFWLILLLK